MRLNRFVYLREDPNFVVIYDRWTRQEFCLRRETWDKLSQKRERIVLKNSVLSLEVGRCDTDATGGTISST